MSASRMTQLAVLFLAVAAGAASAQQKTKLGDNAALRYWAAFAQMQDSTISDEQAKELNLMLMGNAPYDEAKYKDLVEKNRPALETMARGAALQNCDWGLDYKLGPDTPVDFDRKGLALGRLNVLYAKHLILTGDEKEAARTLASGLRFSHDIANGGTLFASAVSTHLLMFHLTTIATLHVEALSPAQRSALRQAIAQLGPEGLDWRSNVKRELEIPHELAPQANAAVAGNGLDTQVRLALARIIPAYVGVLDQPSTLPALQRLISSAPAALQQIIPNPERVLEGRRELTKKIQQTRLLLQE